MENYLGVKLVQAEPQVKDGKDGYMVIYPDNYVSWSPKDVFECAYRKTNGLSFGLAVEALKLGEKVARSGWNGKGMWLRYYDPYHDKEFPISEKPVSEGTPICWIGMKTADNKFVPWLASQTDILSNDWVIVK